MAPRPSPTVLQVFLFRRGEFLGTEVFAERQIVVGRDEGMADLVLESSDISRRHAIIEHDGSNISIRDLESTNGIYVNDAKVGHAVIGRRDEIVVGDFSLKLKLVGRVAKRPAAGDATVALDVEGATPRRDTLAEWDDVSGEHEVPTAPQPPEPAPVVAAPSAPEAPKLDAPSFGAMLETIGIKPAGKTTKDDKRKNEKSVAKTATPPVSVAAPAETEAPSSPAPQASVAEASRTVVEALEPASPPVTTPRDRPTASKLVAAGGWLAGLVTKRKAAATPLPETTGTIEDEVPSKIDAAVALDDAGAPEPTLAPLGDDEDDAEDAAYVPPYSLVEQLTAEAPSLGVPPDEHDGGRPHLEVLTLRGDSVAAVTLMKPGSSFWVGPRVGLLRRLRARDVAPRLRLLRYKRNGACVAELRLKTDGTLARGGEKLDVERIATKRHPRRQTQVVDVAKNDVLDVTIGPFRYQARFVYPPPRLRSSLPLKERLRPSPLAQRAMGGSFASHLVLLVLISLLLPSQMVQPAEAKDEFVEVIMEPEVKLEQPEEPPPEPPSEPQPAAAPETPPRSKQPTPKKRSRAGGTSAAPAGVLGLLSKRGSSAAPGPAAAVAAVSNLSAARVPGGTSGFRVSGLTSKLPTSDLQVGGGGGGPVTKGGAALLRGGGGGAGQLSGKGTRKVGGLVQKVPQAMRAVGQGSLDRDAIQKVINQNISQVQRCYERELIQNPGLSGKIQVEWTIATSGAVKSTRQTFSNLGSTAVSNCIMGAIRGWRFPQPKGGEVVVNYPFIFKSIGF